MILQDKMVKSARKDHRCSNCFRKIKKGDSYRYMYGAPEYYDSPYALKYCAKCDEEIMNAGYDE